jgi:hypothetical protein
MGKGSCTHTPAVEFCPASATILCRTHSSGRGCSPSEVRLRVTRGVPLVEGYHMERGKGDRARGRERGSGREKGEGKPVNSNPFPLHNHYVSCTPAKSG